MVRSSAGRGAWTAGSVVGGSAAVDELVDAVAMAEIIVLRLGHRREVYR
jgi:hypothetical protein